MRQKINRDLTCASKWYIHSISKEMLRIGMNPRSRSIQANKLANKVLFSQRTFLATSDIHTKTLK